MTNLEPTAADSSPSLASSARVEETVMLVMPTPSPACWSPQGRDTFTAWVRQCAQPFFIFQITFYNGKA